MRARSARLIRIGIMAKCTPYKSNVEPDPVFGDYWTVLDFSRLWDIQTDWVLNNENPLVRKAYDRTKMWDSVRYE